MQESGMTVDRRSFLMSGGALGLVASMSGVSMSGVFELAAVHGRESSVPKFVKALPVWAKGRDTEMNVTLAFRASFELEHSRDAMVRMTGSTIARIMVNGHVAGYGPARGPHGWFRIDEWQIAPFLKKGRNTVEITVAGYNSNSYYHLDQPSFLQAEILADGKCLAATGDSGFTAVDLTGARLQKVQRFSFQRPFIEVYDDRKLKDAAAVEAVEQPAVRYLSRGVPYPELKKIEPVAWLESGTIRPVDKPIPPRRAREIVNVGPKLKGYKLDELQIVLSDKMQGYTTTLGAPAKKLPAVYHAGDVQIVDFGADHTGFFGLEIECDEPGSELVVTFDEILNDKGDVDFLRLGTCAAIQWTLDREKSWLEAMEPNVGRYWKIHCLKGSFRLKKACLREYAYPEIREATFTSSDRRLEKLYRAAVLTFRDNSVDVFTDCPHRERAGWLCDSFFTARTAFDLTGKTDIEDVFFENYLLPDKFKCLPDGMLPMCYPADHYDGVFIPNWALWFVVEFEEYARRNPQSALIGPMEKRIARLVTFFEQYENSDGLLEKLPSWIFVEWSKANDFVRDVNYPSNMLYAAALAAAGRIYKRDAWLTKAEKIRAAVVSQSYDGEFFVDNARRLKNGTLEVTRNRSEVCQYFAFFFKTATPESHPILWNTLLNKFGPNRVKDGVYPEIHKANAFVGNVLRLELLSQAGRSEQLLKESVAYNEYMADLTGTLWENDSSRASCNHGFASHVCHVLYRDVLGIVDVDIARSTVTIRFRKFDGLSYAEGKRPIPGGVVDLRWEKKQGTLRYRLAVPANFKVVIENESGLELVEAK